MSYEEDVKNALKYWSSNKALVDSLGIEIKELEKASKLAELQDIYEIDITIPLRAVLDGVWLFDGFRYVKKEVILYDALCMKTEDNEVLFFKGYGKDWSINLEDIKKND